MKENIKKVNNECARMNTICNKNVKSSGITLIALIITIIIMLILVAISIRATINGGLFQKAGQAVKDYGNKQNEENAIGNGEVNIEGTTKEIKRYADSITKEIYALPVGTTLKSAENTENDAMMDDNGILAEKAVYFDGENTATIPAGFKVSNQTGESTIETGLVIKDNLENEFVWIPINNINDMIMCKSHGASVTLNTTTLQCPTCGTTTVLAGKFYAVTTGDSFNPDLTGQTYSKLCGEIESGYYDGYPAWYGIFNDILELNGTEKISSSAGVKAYMQAVFNEMAISVAKYHGFYVGRYETSNMKSEKRKCGSISCRNNNRN